MILETSLLLNNASIYGLLARIIIFSLLLAYDEGPFIPSLAILLYIRIIFSFGLWLLISLICRQTSNSDCIILFYFSATWGGARLVDILELVGVSKLSSVTSLGGKHVEFTSVDRCKVSNWILIPEAVSCMFTLPSYLFRRKLLLTYLSWFPLAFCLLIY